MKHSVVNIDSFSITVCIFIFCLLKGFGVTCNTRHDPESREENEERNVLKKQTSFSVRVDIAV